MKTPTTETRKGSPLLLVVLVVVSLVLITVSMREGDGGPLHGTRRGLLLITTPFAIAGDWAARPFEGVSRWFAGLSTSRDEVTILRTQNDQMRSQLATLTEALAENERLRELVKLPATVRGTSVGARVIGRPTDSWEGSILVDRGSSDGVATGTPVMAAQGLIGRVVVVASHSAKVRLITDQTSGVAVLVQATRAAGVVHGSVEGRLSLDYVDPKTVVKRGDVLVTSGLGGVYPKGLVVGDVSQVETDTAGLFPHVVVTSRVPVDHIEEVVVLVGAQTQQTLGGIE
jgi:rod shape-determining protein MreC